MKKEIFRIENGIKENNGSEMLSGVYLQAYKGEILGVISDNISEKKCLIEVLGGNVDLDYGYIYINDKKINEYETTISLKGLIVVIERRSKLIENLTVAENIFVVRGGFKKYLLNKKVLCRQAQQLMNEFGITIQAKDIVEHLTNLEKCIVELLKAYTTGRKLIVLSDITTFLNSREVDKFMQLVFALKKRGIDFIIVENFDGLLCKYSDRIIVIHKGKTVRILDNNNLDRKVIYSLLLGEEGHTSSSSLRIEKKRRSTNKVSVLRLDNIWTSLLSGVSLELCRGEVVDLLYQDNESCDELLRLLQGELFVGQGEMKLLDQSYKPRGMWDAINQGVCFLEENPIEKMLFYDMSVLDNLCFTMGNKVSGMWLKKKYRRSIIDHMKDFFDEEFLLTPLSQLGPSHLQKLAYGKWLLYVPKVIVCHKPFSTSDIYMRQVAEQMIEEYTKRGVAVLIITPNISEACVMGEKIMYLKKGKIIEY